MPPLADYFQEGLDFLLECFSLNVILSGFIPAFFIAGAITVFVSKEAVLKYFGPQAKRLLAYGVATVSGTVLTV